MRAIEAISSAHTTRSISDDPASRTDTVPQLWKTMDGFARVFWANFKDFKDLRMVDQGG